MHTLNIQLTYVDILNIQTYVVFQYRLVYHFCWPNDRRMDLSIYRITSSNLVYFLVSLSSSA